MSQIFFLKGLYCCEVDVLLTRIQVIQKWLTSDSGRPTPKRPKMVSKVTPDPIFEPFLSHFWVIFSCPGRPLCQDSVPLHELSCPRCISHAAFCMLQLQLRESNCLKTGRLLDLAWTVCGVVFFSWFGLMLVRWHGVGAKECGDANPQPLNASWRNDTSHLQWTFGYLLEHQTTVAWVVTRGNNNAGQQVFYDYLVLDGQQRRMVACSCNTRPTWGTPVKFSGNSQHLRHSTDKPACTTDKGKPKWSMCDQREHMGPAILNM